MTDPDPVSPTVSDEEVRSAERARAGYPIRELGSDTIWFVTNRAPDGHFFFVPVAAVTDAFCEWLARSALKYGILIYAFIFESNHFHLICEDPQMRLDDFMRDFESQSSRQINKRWGRRRASCYGRRYSAEPILDQDALIEKITYIVTNPVKDGLVARALDWPGFSCAGALLHNHRIIADCFDRTRFHNAGGALRTQLGRYKYQLEITLAVPESLRHMSPADRAAFWRSKVREVETRCRQERKATGRSVLGVRGILRQHHLAKPRSSKQTPRPLCHATNPDDRNAYRKHRLEFLEMYAEASFDYLGGRHDVEFPAGSFRPRIPTPTFPPGIPPPMPDTGSVTLI